VHSGLLSFRSLKVQVQTGNSGKVPIKAPCPPLFGAGRSAPLAHQRPLRIIDERCERIPAGMGLWPKARTRTGRGECGLGRPMAHRRKSRPAGRVRPVRRGGHWGSFRRIERPLRTSRTGREPRWFAVVHPNGAGSGMEYAGRTGAARQFPGCSSFRPLSLLLVRAPAPNNP
jgi:hypothetical protein